MVYYMIVEEILEFRLLSFNCFTFDVGGNYFLRYFSLDTVFALKVEGGVFPPMDTQAFQEKLSDVLNPTAGVLAPNVSIQVGILP